MAVNVTDRTLRKMGLAASLGLLAVADLIFDGPLPAGTLGTGMVLGCTLTLIWGVPWR